MSVLCVHVSCWERNNHSLFEFALTCVFNIFVCGSVHVLREKQLLFVLSVALSGMHVVKAVYGCMYIFQAHAS